MMGWGDEFTRLFLPFLILRNGRRETTFCGSANTYPLVTLRIIHFTARSAHSPAENEKKFAGSAADARADKGREGRQSREREEVCC
eukprot:3933026-Rhodomonas_salina.4